MKRIVSVLCVAALLAALLSFSACGKKNTDISGAYTLIELTSNGKDITEDLSSVDVTLTIEGDQATFSYMEMTQIWTVDTKAQTMSIDSGSKIPYTIEGDRLTVAEEGGLNKMVFEKQ